MKNRKTLNYFLKKLGISYDLPSELSDFSPVGITADSRKVKKGFVFVAKKGLNFDGHNFLKSAYKNGAVCAFVEKIYDIPGFPQIKTESVNDILPELLSLYYDRPETKFKKIALTGTNGKTTTSYILDSIFSKAGYVTGVIGTISYRYADVTESAPFTSPDPEILYPLLHRMVEKGVEVLIMEVSSHALKQKRIGNLKFDAALLTNFTQDHLDFHKTMDDYAASKRILFEKHLKDNAIVAVWSETLRKNEIIPELLSKTEYSLNPSSQVDYKCVDYNLSVKGITGYIKTPESKFPFKLKLIGEHNILNLTGALIIADGFGISTRTSLKAVENTIVPGRLEPVGERLNIFVDYAHTPDALDRAQDSLNKLKKSGRLITVFGCGGERDAQKRPLMGKSVNDKSEIAIVTSDNPRREDPLKIIEEILTGMEGKKLKSEDVASAKKGIIVIPDRRQAIFTAIQGANEADLILIAGKGHEDYQILGTEKIHFDDKEVAAEAEKLKWK